MQYNLVRVRYFSLSSLRTAILYGIPEHVFYSEPASTSYSYDVEDSTVLYEYTSIWVRGLIVLCTR